MIPEPEAYDLTISFQTYGSENMICQHFFSMVPWISCSPSHLTLVDN